MASEEIVMQALDNYLSPLKDPQDQLLLSHDFETENIRARIRHGKERWFFSITDSVYETLPDEVIHLEQFFKNMSVFERMKGTSRDNAFWIIVEDGKITGAHGPLRSDGAPVSDF